MSSNSISKAELSSLNKNRSFTATGSITKANIVSLRSDGTIESVTSSSNASTWIGIAAENISSGQTGQIYVVGGLADGFSSLTVDADYYVNDNGTVGTSSTSNGKIGRAASSTEIYITSGNA